MRRAEENSSRCGQRRRDDGRHSSHATGMGLQRLVEMQVGVGFTKAEAA
jgi:hypothetical protein